MSVGIALSQEHDQRMFLEVFPHSRKLRSKMASLVVLALAAVVLLLFLRILNLTDSSRVPKIFTSKSPLTNAVLKSCPILFEK